MVPLLVLASEFRSRFTLYLFIILLVRFGLLSGHLLGKSCPFGWPCDLIVFGLLVILVISRLVLRAGFGC